MDNNDESEVVLLLLLLLDLRSCGFGFVMVLAL
jgi:hypothetical protein